MIVFYVIMLFVIFAPFIAWVYRYFNEIRWAKQLGVNPRFYFNGKPRQDALRPREANDGKGEA